MNTNSIRVSHSVASLNLYMPRHIAKMLKPVRYGARVVAVERNGKPDGFHLFLEEDTGNHSINETGRTDAEYTHRLSLLPSSVRDIDKLPKFGVFEVTHVDYGLLQGTTVVNGSKGREGIFLKIPEMDYLPAPMRRQKRSHIGDGSGRQLSMKLVDKAPETPHAHLGRLLRETNALLASGALDDVELHVKVEGQPIMVISDLVECKIVGKVIKTEYLGE